MRKSVSPAAGLSDGRLPAERIWFIRDAGAYPHNMGSAEPSRRLDVRIDLLRRMERRLAEKSDPDIALLALVRELLREAEAEHDRTHRCGADSAVSSGARTGIPGSVQARPLRRSLS